MARKMRFLHGGLWFSIAAGPHNQQSFLNLRYSHRDPVDRTYAVFIRLATSILNLAADAEQLAIGDLCTDLWGHHTIELEFFINAFSTSRKMPLTRAS